MICLSDHGSDSFSSSLWWRSPPDISSVSFDHDVVIQIPLSWGRRVANSVDTVTASQDHCCKSGIRVGVPLLYGTLASFMKTSVERYSTDGTV